MALQTMYPAKNNSPATVLTEGITAESTSMTLYDASVLPDAPNICVIGNDDTAEIVSYTGISGNTVTGLGRGINGTIKKVWSADTYVARNITAYDHEAFRANILDLDNRKTDSGHTHDDRYYTKTEMDTTLALKAPLASPALTGTPTAPTPASGDDSTKIATTEWVTDALVAGFRDVYKVTLPSASSSKLTFSAPGITADHVLCVEGHAYYSNPSAVMSELSITTAANSITITGTLSGTTDIIVTLGIPRTITAS